MRISTRMEFFNATYFNRHWLNIYSAWYCRCRITFTANDPFLLVAVFVLLEVQIAFTIGLLIKNL